ncbi:hypothetical protein CDAR_484711 [Caerostris darwini]|uniref:Uncharacterized protein n=1 Tax=Caerostris darwini TaxID=1538125 RepID=A0AAV4WWM2_9ARAC|nr:hypothetical protein CDAR_484711 [Caerostris darwini]
MKSYCRSHFANDLGSGDYGLRILTVAGLPSKEQRVERNPHCAGGTMGCFLLCSHIHFATANLNNFPQVLGSGNGLLLFISEVELKELSTNRNNMPVGLGNIRFILACRFRAFYSLV